MQIVKVTIHTPTIELSQLLKLAGVCMSGGEAKTLILEGAVTLNGQSETRRSKKISPGDSVGVGEVEIQVSATEA